MPSDGQDGSAYIMADINYFPATGKVIETKDWRPRLLGDTNEFSRKMTIRDIRGLEDEFDLDNNGFKFIKLQPKPRDTSTDDKIQQEYYPEVAEILKNLYERASEPSPLFFLIPRPSAARH